MPKQFNKNKKYVFTKKKFLKDRGIRVYRECKEWVDKCNGRTVTIRNSIDGTINGFRIYPSWCKEVR